MPRITEMYAFVAEDRDPEDEGIIAMVGLGDTALPMVGADPDRVKSLVGYAELVKQVTGKPYKILRFTVREDVTEQYTKAGKGGG